MSRHIKSFYIENLGCAKNQVDAETLVYYLQSNGWSLAGSADEAGYIIVNSCGFIKPAKEESIDAVLDFRKRFPDKKIILAGCLAQRYGKELSSLEGAVNGIFGNRNLAEIPGYLERIDPPHLEVYTGEERLSLPQREHFFSFPGSVYVKVSEGCDNRCSFCAIPIIRGPLESRTREDITSEVRRLVDMGIREINLVGQDLGAFGTDRGGVETVQLLSDLSAVKGDFWIRLLYIHPDHFPEDILQICRSDPRILPYFDIPFQHGSTAILKRMGRRGSAGEYLELVRRIRSVLPDAVIRTTFLVGFPGESARDFDSLVEFQQNLKADWLGVFTYSREEGTPAASIGRLKTVFPKTAERRREKLMSLQEGITAANMKRFKKRIFPVLLEEKVEGEDLFLGRIYAQAPEVDGLTVVRTDKAAPGDLLMCRITGINGYDLEAVPISGI